MNTPIYDFVRKYAESNTVRAHMPGHKGKTRLGFEALDLTEIKGADSLYEADGIIAQSEHNASLLFGCKTFYSAEGSSLAIRAMLYLTLLYARENHKNPIIYAGRNAHKTFINTAALLDFEVVWLTEEGESSYLSAPITSQSLERRLSQAAELPAALYVTTPDYLGNTVDVKGLSEVCRKYGILLLADNAHGAYLRFLPTSAHPMDLGADMCCDSAHKTLPVITGGAYLHVNNSAPALFAENAKKAMSMFGSTSPSYLILQSLDVANPYLESGYRSDLAEVIKRITALKAKLTQKGYTLSGNEPLKLTVTPKAYGYSGEDLAEELRSSNIECEFADPDHTVMMFTTDTEEGELEAIEKALLSLPKRQPITELPPPLTLPRPAMTPREAALAPRECVSAEESLGRTLAFAEVGCPPAVPIIVSGEVIDENTLKAFGYYGITRCCVVKNI